MAGPRRGAPPLYLAALTVLLSHGVVSGVKVRTPGAGEEPGRFQRVVRPSDGAGQSSVPSSGCLLEKSTGNFNDGFHMHVHLPWSEPGLPPVNRSYGLYLPSNYDSSKPAPLVLVFHGWGEGAEYHRNYDFGKLADRESFVVVYPIGMDDCNTPDCQRYTSWNGAGTTGSKGAKMACDPSVQTYNYCYDSCRVKKGTCSPCDWTTCYDDVGFIRKVLELVQSRLCIDRTRVFAHGCSNGAMFVHELARRMPGVLAGIVASCGGKPHVGWEGGLPAGGPPISVATIVGNHDDTIPRNGSLSGLQVWDGFLYVPEQKLMQVYKQYNNCTNVAHRRYGAGLHAQNMTCWEEGYACAGGASVAHCLFTGPHDFNVGMGLNRVMDDVEFAWTFMHEHPLASEFLASV